MLAKEWALKFSEQWPPNCPPNDAIDASGIVYRLVNHDPPQSDDFQTHFETGKLPKGPPCMRCGLSVFRTLHDAVHLRKLFSRLGKWIAMATLSTLQRKTKLTSGSQPTHTTWWVYDGVERASLFSVVEEEV
jgi:hypothetical protein